MAEDIRLVTVGCPRCGRPFVLAVGALGVGYELDVDEFSCECELGEDEWEEMCDQAIAIMEGRA
jgi:hypothetical protein